VADETGAVDLSRFLTLEQHNHTGLHRMGVSLRRPDAVLPSHPNYPRVGEGENPASEDHSHVTVGAYIRTDGVQGPDDRLFANQIDGAHIYKGTMIFTTDAGDPTNKRWLYIRGTSDWFGVELTLSTINGAPAKSYTSVDPTTIT
jgi:hypothetical protein